MSGEQPEVWMDTPDDTPPYSVALTDYEGQITRLYDEAAVERIVAARMAEGAWVCGRCRKAPETHADPASECVYEPVWSSEEEVIRADERRKVAEEIARAIRALAPASDDSTPYGRAIRETARIARAHLDPADARDDKEGR